MKPTLAILSVFCLFATSVAKAQFPTPVKPPPPPPQAPQQNTRQTSRSITFHAIADCSLGYRFLPSTTWAAHQLTAGQYFVVHIAPGKVVQYGWYRLTGGDAPPTYPIKGSSPGGIQVQLP